MRGSGIPHKSNLESREWLRWLAPLLIAFLTVATFLPALQNGFVDWDDDRNFLTNAHYRGLGWAELRWMFTTLHMGHYQPLSWVTLGLDYLLWGMNPFGYHLTSLLLHAGNAVLFYFVVLRLLSIRFAPGASSEIGLRAAALVSALLFAIHPLRVESAVWITERRDVLSGFFILWAILFYLRAVVQGTDASRWRWMVASVLLYIFSLLSKVIGLTLPVVLLVLDVDPLGRLGGGRGRWFGRKARAIWLEKVLFLIPALAFGIVAPIAVRQFGALMPLDKYGIAQRVAQVFYSLTFYLRKTIFPVHLSPLYELPSYFNPWDWPFVLSGIFVIGASVCLLVLRRGWPAGLALWIIYGVVLAPTSGIVQNGPQIVADRYSYLSCLGWAALAGAGAFYLWEYRQSGKLRHWGFAFATGLTAIFVFLGAASWRQTQVWHDSETLYKTTIALTDGSRFPSSFAHYNLGTFLARRGHLEEAIEQVRMALQINPLYQTARENLASFLAKKGDLEGAIGQYRVALQLDPLNGQVHYNLATILALRGDLANAIEQYRMALRLNFANERAYTNLGNVLADSGDLPGAIDHYRRALQINPGFELAHYHLANALASQGDLAGAIDHYRRALQINPMDGRAHNGLGKALAKRGDLGEAIEHYLQAITIRPDDSDAIENLRRALEERDNKR